MDVMSLWRMWHIAEDGVCSCGEPVTDCIYWALLLPAWEAAQQAQYEKLFAVACDNAARLNESEPGRNSTLNDKETTRPC